MTEQNPVPLQPLPSQSAASKATSFDESSPTKTRRIGDHEIPVVKLTQFTPNTTKKLAKIFNDPRFTYLEEGRRTGPANESSTTKAAVLQESNGKRHFALVTMGPGDVEPEDIQTFSDKQSFLAAVQKEPQSSGNGKVPKSLVYATSCLAFLNTAAASIRNDGRQDFLQSLEKIEAENNMLWVEPSFGMIEMWAEDDIENLKASNCYGIIFKALRMSELLSKDEMEEVIDSAYSQTLRLTGKDEVETLDDQEIALKIVIDSICRTKDHFRLTDPHLSRNPAEPGDILFIGPTSEAPRHVAVVTGRDADGDLEFVQLGSCSKEGGEWVRHSGVNKSKLSNLIEMHQAHLENPSRQAPYGDDVVVCKVFDDKKHPRVEL